MHSTIRIFLFTFFTIISLSQIWGQKILVSDELNLKNDYTYDFIGAPDGNVLLFRDRAFSYEVNAFDEQMRLRWVRELDFQKRKIDIVGSTFQDTQFHIFYSFREGPERFLQVHSYDVNAFLKDSLTVFIDRQLASGARWRFSKSENENKVVLFSPAENKQVRFICFDVAAMQPQWDIQVPFADTLAGKDFKQMLVTNEGDMIMVLENYSGGLMKAKYHQEIWTYSPGWPEMQKLDIEVDEWVAQDARYVYDNRNQQLVGISLIGEREAGRSKGILKVVIGNRLRKFVSQNIDMVDEELLQELYGQEGKVPKGLADFRLRDLVLTENGGVVVFMELIKEYSRKPTYPYSNIRNDGPLNLRRWVDFYHEDILTIAYDVTGKRLWNTTLRKRQYSQDDDGIFSSYYLFRTPSFVHLVYNDEIRNENTVSEYVLNGDGEFVRNSLLSTASQRLKLRFRDAIQTSANSFVVPSERTNKLMLVKFIY